MKCLAIDDEPLALNIIKDFCDRIDFIELVAVCTNPLEAIRIINQQEIDLIFLDIQMPNISGLEFIKAVKNPPLFILTTAYSTYALEGFELNATDYLVKPFAFERFFRAVNKAYETMSLKSHKQGQNNQEARSEETMDYLMIKVEYRMVRIELKSILFIEGLKDYVKIYTGNRPLLTKSTMKNIEERLPSDQYVRVHKSFIVALSKIDSIENNRIIIGEKYIPIGNQYRNSFYSLLDSKRL
jgi:two-component system, LytTR family, response regulator